MRNSKFSSSHLTSSKSSSPENRKMAKFALLAVLAVLGSVACQASGYGYGYPIVTTIVITSTPPSSPPPSYGPTPPPPATPPPSPTPDHSNPTPTASPPPPATPSPSPTPGYSNNTPAASPPSPATPPQSPTPTSGYPNPTPSTPTVSPPPPATPPPSPTPSPGYGYPTPTPSTPTPPPASPPAPSPPAAGLKVGYYAANCPNAEKIVMDAVSKASVGVMAGLVRLFFHDCFVRGCDASVLLNQVAGKPDPEMLGIPNLSLRGFEVIDAAKEALEVECPGIVSCADIVAFAGRDASKILSYGKIDIKMPAGRYDGNVSLKDDTLPNLPPPFADVATLTKMFADKGLSKTDMVVLSGAHSIGRSHCSSFRDRLPPPTNDTTGTAMSTTLASKLSQDCSAGGDPTVDQDDITPYVLDNQYYKNVINRRVLFTSDAALMTSLETKVVVFASLFEGAWNTMFENSMVKMGNIGVKSSIEGDIRKKCGFINKPYTG